MEYVNKPNTAIEVKIVNLKSKLTELDEKRERLITNLRVKPRPGWGYKRGKWHCPECGTDHDRDINVARNIKAAGLAVLAHGEPVNPESLKAA